MAKSRVRQLKVVSCIDLCHLFHFSSLILFSALSLKIDNLESFLTDVESYKKKGTIHDENLEVLSYYEEFAHIGMETIHNNLRDEYFSLSEIKTNLKERRDALVEGDNHG